MFHRRIEPLQTVESWECPSNKPASIECTRSTEEFKLTLIGVAMFFNASYMLYFLHIFFYYSSARDVKQRTECGMRRNWQLEKAMLKSWNSLVLGLRRQGGGGEGAPVDSRVHVGTGNMRRCETTAIFVQGKAHCSLPVSSCDIHDLKQVSSEYLVRLTSWTSYTVRRIDCTSFRLPRNSFKYSFS